MVQIYILYIHILVVREGLGYVSNIYIYSYIYWLYIEGLVYGSNIYSIYINWLYREGLGYGSNIYIYAYIGCTEKAWDMVHVEQFQ